MPAALFDKAKKVLTEYIREHHLRSTIERTTILQYICKYKTSFSAEQLIQDVCKTEHMSIATIYNTLDLLVQCRLLSKLPAHMGSPCDMYELVLLHSNQLSFFCTNCGREVAFQDKAIDDIIHGKRFSNFTMDHFSLRVYGTCKKCRRKPLKL